MTADADASRPTLLIVSQVYVPDPAALGQYVHDAAAGMVERGWRVVVYTSARGYDDPAQRYTKRETLAGVQVRRLPWSSFGKRSMRLRLLGQGLFVMQATLRGLFGRRPSVMLVSTSPPMAGVTGLVVGSLRRVPVVDWVMDINPDQAVAMGQVGPRSVLARLLDAMHRRLLRRAAAVVTLDQAMAARLEAKQPVGDRMHVIPPWPLTEMPTADPHAGEAFRREHGLEGKRVLMYSGNLSAANPIETVLDALATLKDETDFAFVIVGSRSACEQVEAYQRRGVLENILTLPYQPLDRLHESLSAADVHLVSIGDDMVGIVHPCKGYGAMAVRRPLLVLGPAHSAMGTLVERKGLGWRVDHGDTEAAAATLQEINALSVAELRERGELAGAVLDETFDRETWRQAFCDVIVAAKDGSRGDT